jgi:hypothetical protein
LSIIRGDAVHRQRVRERLLSRAIPDLDGPRPVDDSPCWFFSIKPDARTGYCHFSVGKQKGILAHRAAYELWYGEIPHGAEIDHLCHPGDGSCPPEICKHRRCVNPAHLRAVTHRANTLRSSNPAALNATKTHCLRGHPYDEANTGSNGRNSTARACRTCGREKRRRRVAAGLLKYEPRPKPVACKRGHPWTPDNTYTTPDGRRRCRACMRIRDQKSRGKSPEDAAA